MKTELFAELMESANEALAHARGKQELRTTTLPGAPRAMEAAEIRSLREQLNASQSVFAHYLNVSTKLVQAWEANRRRPEGAALRLLEIAERDPNTVFAGLSSKTGQKSPRNVGAKASLGESKMTRAKKHVSSSKSRKRELETA